MTQTVKTLLFLIVIVFVLLLFNLGARPVSKIQEVRIAETAREMLASGDYTVPRYNGELRLQKPPLPYWTAVASYQVFGINEFAVRLPAVLFGLLTALVLFLFIKKEAGLTAASHAFLIAITTFISIRYFRSGEADAMLLCFIGVACTIGYWLVTQNGAKNLQSKHTGYLQWLFGLSVGLAFLSKGPAGIAIPLLSVLLFAWQQKTLPQFKQCFSVSGLVVFFVIAGAWYAWIFWKLPDVAQHFMGKQLDETFVSGTHAKPFYWYFAHFFEFFMPWGFLLPLAVITAKQRFKDQSLKPYVQFAWVWLIVVLVLLTFTVNKQMQYALLFLPPLAIILGDYTSQNFNEKNRKLATINRWFYGLALFTLATLMLYFLIQKFAIEGVWLVAIMAIAGGIFYALNLHKKSVQASIFLIAIGMLAVSIYAEQFASKEPRKVAAQKMLEELKIAKLKLAELKLAELKMAPLKSGSQVYQASPGDGAYSFYAKQIIPPIKETQLAALVKQKGEIFWITQSRPTDPSIKYALIKKIDDVSLYRLTTTNPDTSH